MLMLRTHCHLCEQDRTLTTGSCKDILAKHEPVRKVFHCQRWKHVSQSIVDIWAQFAISLPIQHSKQDSLQACLCYINPLMPGMSISPRASSWCKRIHVCKMRMRKFFQNQEFSFKIWNNRFELDIVYLCVYSSKTTKMLLIIFRINARKILIQQLISSARQITPSSISLKSKKNPLFKAHSPWICKKPNSIGL